MNGTSSASAQPWQLPAANVNALAGKYLTFRLAREEYGLPILTVREIIGLVNITPVPRAPHEIRGVINLRGKIIPVVDLRRKFGMSDTEALPETCIVVVNINALEESLDMGILVDSVSEVLDVKKEDIGPPPSFGKTISTDFILGMAKLENRVAILLEIEKLLTTSDLSVGKGNEIEAAVV
jgi:purine-binding chemotaxis protein CheW